jgi:hypothetical protein
VDEVVIGPREVPFWPLDLDYSRSGIGETGRGKRRRDRLLEGDDENAFEIAHGFPPFVVVPREVTGRLVPLAISVSLTG